MAVQIFSEGDTDYIIQQESGFSVAAVDITEGFNAKMRSSRSWGVGYHNMVDYLVTQAGGFALGAGFQQGPGIYTVQEDGYFLISALQVTCLCVCQDVPVCCFLESVDLCARCQCF